MRIDRDAITAAICFLLGFGLFLVATRVDDLATLGQARDANEGLRGPFVDRSGVPLSFTQDGTRHLALPNLVPIIGYRDSASVWHGLEARYSDFLDSATAERDWRTFFLHLRGASVHGGTVRLTLDSKIQRAAGRALGRNPGAVVALDPATGAILAMISSPSCSAADLSTRRGLARCRRDPSRPLLNRATERLVPPGSTFKIVTLSAALDTKKLSLTTVFSGVDAFGPSPLFDNSTYPSNVRAGFTRVNVKQALAFSDNFVFAHIGLTLKSPSLLRYAHRFYVGKSIPFEMPVARSTVANDRARPSPSELAQSSFGSPVDQVTPLQMALIAGAVANGGRLMAPHIVQDLETAGGRITWRYRPHLLSRVMSRRAAAQMTKAMEFVVQLGSGFLAKISGVEVAGKTGTAASGASQPHAWFVCFAPAIHPVVAVAVLHEFGGEGFQYAAPIARQVLVAALRERGMRIH
jgi:peptidoglycan glycosyltransferase